MSLQPVVSLRSTTGYTLERLRRKCQPASVVSPETLVNLWLQEKAAQAS